MSIEKIMCLSTGHITQATAEIIDRGVAMLAIEDPNERDEEPPFWMLGMVIYPHGEYGWLIHIGGDIAEDHTVRAHIPSELLDVIVYADDNGCEWLLLDRDGDKIDELNSFDW